MNNISPGSVGAIYETPASKELGTDRRSAPNIDPRHRTIQPTHGQARSNRLNRPRRPAVSTRRRFLHWITALALVALYLPLNSIGVDTHKLIGTLLLGFFFARMIASLSGDRVNHTRHGKIENFAAVTIQGFILCSLLVLPISGLLIHALSGPGVAIGGFSEQFLKFPVPSPALVRGLIRLHFFLSTVLLIAVFLHVSGALKHHFIKRDDTLSRMFTGGLKSKDPSAYTPPSIVHRGRLLSLVVMIALLVGAGWIHINKETQAYGLTNWEDRIEANSTPNSYGLSPLLPSNILIAGRHHGRAFKATFDNFKVALDLTDDGEPIALNVVIDASSFRSDLIRRDKLVASEHWLNTESHPLIEYQSSRFKLTDNDTYVANGYLNFKKLSVPVPVEFKLNVVSKGDGQLLTKGNISLDRFGLGLGTGPWFNTEKVARSFDLSYQVHLSKSVRN